MWIPEDDDIASSGLPESAVLNLPAPRAAVAPARVATGDEGFVSIGELLVWERTEDEGPIDTRFGRLASLLGIAAVALPFLALMFAAGTDVVSVLRNVPGS